MAAAALTVTPIGLGFSGGIGTGDPGYDPTHGGCISCHGGEAFSSQAAGIDVTFTDADGAPLTGPYHGGDTYTVTVTLDELNMPEADNHAGFNLWADGGTFAEIDDTARVVNPGEITHATAGFTQWNAEWTAPSEGPVTFRLFVNDVDGSAAPDEADEVYLKIFSLTDDHYDLPGAVEEEEVHVGVPLPQYWLGLIALAGMLFIMLFAFVYLKYVSPHNADQKDR